MYIAASHHGCPGDLVYLVAIQNQERTPCEWEQDNEDNLPKILYSDTVDEASNAVECELLAISLSSFNHIQIGEMGIVSRLIRIIRSSSLFDMIASYLILL